jgi:hypothetical protein
MPHARSAARITRLGDTAGTIGAAFAVIDQLLRAAPTVGRMPEFLAETYLSRLAPAPGAASLARAAERVSGQQAPVRFLGAIYVAEEETCFYLYQAPAAADVQAAMTAAGLRPERITRAVPIRPPGSWWRNWVRVASARLRNLCGRVTREFP